MDGCMTKAPCGGDKAGPSPVDRGKGGLKRSVATEGTGVPVGIVSAGANRHDSPLLAPTLAQVAAQVGPAARGCHGPSGRRLRLRGHPRAARGGGHGGGDLPQGRPGPHPGRQTVGRGTHPRSPSPIKLGEHLRKVEEPGDLDRRRGSRVRGRPRHRASRATDCGDRRNTAAPSALWPRSLIRAVSAPAQAGRRRRRGGRGRPPGSAASHRRGWSDSAGEPGVEVGRQGCRVAVAGEVEHPVGERQHARQIAGYQFSMRRGLSGASLADGW